MLAIWVHKCHQKVDKSVKKQRRNVNVTIFETSWSVKRHKCGSKFILEGSISKVKHYSLPSLQRHSWKVDFVLARGHTFESCSQKVPISPKHYLSIRQVNTASNRISDCPVFSIVCILFIPTFASESVIRVRVDTVSHAQVMRKSTVHL